jgi:phosphoheptose isomerase
VPYTSEICDELLASIDVKKLILEDRALLNQIEGLALECLEALHAGAKIIFAGNGGSFADAQHLSAEFVSRFKFDRSPLASLTLGTNSSAIMQLLTTMAMIKYSQGSWRQLLDWGIYLLALVLVAIAQILFLPLRWQLRWEFQRRA